MSDPVGTPVVAVALDGVGWHPGAWRRSPEEARRSATAAYWRDLVLPLDDAGVDVVTWEDPFGIPGDGYGEPAARADRLRVAPEPVLLASALAPSTRRVALVPSVVTTHTEPFHVATAVATLDHASLGRAGVRLRADATRTRARLLGRRDLPPLQPATRDDPVPLAARDEVFADAGEVAEVLGRLWDSWEDDAEIRDATTGRFVDRDRLHHIDFVGDHLAVKGPSIVPRSPQGRPPVLVLAHDPRAFALAAAAADVVLVTPNAPYPGDDAAGSVARVRATEAAAGRAEPPLRVLGEVVVVLGATREEAARRLAELDALARPSGGAWRSDAAVVVGTPADLLARVGAWRAAGLDGLRLRPAEHAVDLPLLLGQVLPHLVDAGRPVLTLRERLGLERPRSRYAAPTREDAS
ncbi:alkanesulfonate monooxygenase SsuD/methylene tetrahydromethanopterin reductase-like flavin-dependent oxidoreductase (luciferase family) [Nocardioides zeae]|uniref:Alkanesulfonate monooxygenase SsuD/methylene tetrahydromethanopterin reductase-like flavin-dependent oxidoreductase (Luciferase family) n=1 Tax=Nocardioides zeae TaxID=1457234 RepID=A0ACC6IN30_9ACTN|nr:LLM class flavin-dependent oxidoreductase [Nocardioides zeae]MDR6173370.1 alkanesulfonate monooxygenase SsuD/methylene tetrahydromethanopterin reductase-like flavin-dependent oxidoreductase (luciferase family) [Nocardioides zeae]MDR6212010.1 alkanesulfonate monooxygenase SsuD/methylene tetrahydromethanopterin reductase-like flavin-dependent oxidoreductase (luciferase family) [Nocardioides zeae]